MGFFLFPPTPNYQFPNKIKTWKCFSFYSRRQLLISHTFLKFLHKHVKIVLDKNLITKYAWPSGKHWMIDCSEWPGKPVLNGLFWLAADRQACESPPLIGCWIQCYGGRRQARQEYQSTNVKMEKSWYYRIQYSMGSTILSRQFVKAFDNELIGDVIERNLPAAGANSEECYRITTVVGLPQTQSAGSATVTSREKTDIDLSMPVPCLEDFGVKNIEVQLVLPSTAAAPSTSSDTAFEKFSILIFLSPPIH